MRGGVIAGLCLGLSGCDWAWTLAKEAVIAPTGRYGWSDFTFKGELPAHFGIKAIAFYGPVDHNQDRCRERTFTPGQTQARRQVDAYEAKISAEPQSFSFDIPLSYSVGFCSMELENINLEIDGRFGDKEWQASYGKGGFYIVRELRPGSPNFDERGNMAITSECQWLFQESKIRLQLSKLLTCKGAGARLQRDQLAGKTVSLAITVNPEERPYYAQTWIKFNHGWKPCLPKEGGWIKCQDPPVFKTFKMNGQTCTLYPGCTE